MSGVLVAWIVTKSEIATSSSIVSASCTPSWRARSGAHERVVRDEAHAERVRTLRDQHADPAEPDDPERLAVELDAFPLRAVPAAGAQVGVRLRHVARLREQQAPSCARRPRGCSTAARSRPSRRAWSPRRRRRCRGRCRPGPTTTRSVPAASTSAVTWVALRITSAATPGSAAQSSSGVRPVLTSTSSPAARIASSPRSASGSATRTRDAIDA